MVKKTSFAGNLDYLSIGDLFQLLGANGSTGVLRVNSRYSGNPCIIYLNKGNPVNAKCGELTGLDAVYALFGWTDGDFEFKEESIKCQVIIKKSRMEIILEGTRMVDDGLIETVGPVAEPEKPSGDSDPSSGIPVINGPAVDYMCVADEEDYADGDTIVKQGKHGNWSWVVLEGIVEIRKETPKGQLPIARIGSGSFIGNVAALLLPGNVRSASVVAIGNVQLGVLDMQRLSMEYARLTSLFKTFIISLDKRVKQTTSRTVELYSKKKADVKSFMKGKKPLIKQGGSHDKIYLIEQGKAYIVRTTKKGHFLLANLEDDDFIGRVPFFNIEHEPEAASVYGSEDLELKEIDYEPLLNEYEKLSVTFKNMIENYATFVSATSKIACSAQGVSKKK